MVDLPTVISSAGLVPQAPADIRSQILTTVTTANPGVTANLPGTLIEDILSTDVASVVLCDTARVELVDSVTPKGANAWLLSQLGSIYGVSLGAATNTSVQVIFYGPVGTVIPNGFIVSDGTYSYSCSGGSIQTGGQSNPLYCIATTIGSWTVPAGTVTIISTPLTNVTVTCSNPYPGTPGLSAQTESDYRAQVLRAGRVAGIGTPSYFKTVVATVSGVQERLIAFQMVTGGGWKAIVGGGDPYAVAYAIYQSVLDISTLTGSVMQVTNITQASVGVVSTLLNHGYANGQVVQMTGVLGMTTINNIPLTVTVIDEKTFSIGISTLIMPAYVSGGVLTPNFRNNLIAIRDYPDVYQIPYVSPPQQAVTMTVLWNTSAVNYINNSAVAQLAAPAVAAVINAISVGQPINVYDLESAFRDAVSPILPNALLTRMLFEVSINGIGTAPVSGTGIINGDPESYFLTDSLGGDITVQRG